MSSPSRDRLYDLIGKRIRLAREQQGLSQTDLAKRVSVKRVSIVNIEKGIQHTPLFVLYEIATALDLDIHTLLPTIGEISEPLHSMPLARRIVVNEATKDQPENKRLILEFLTRVSTGTQRLHDE